MKRTGSNINGQNNDLNAADRAAQPHQLSAANHGNPDTTYSDHIKAPAFNRRTLGVASVLGLLFASLLAVTLFSTSADNSASSAPKFDAKTVSENTIFAFAQLKPAEFSTASNFYHSVLDPADVSNTPKAGGALAPSRNQGVAETSAAQPSSTDSARSQCSGAACASPRRAPVTEVTVKLFKLGVEKLFSPKDPVCSSGKLCSAADGVPVAGAEFALYEGASVDAAKKVGENFTVGADGFEISGLQPGEYVLKEVAAPDGYEPYPKAVKFTVEKGGRAKYKYSKFTRYFENNEFYFPNVKSVSTKVKLFKLGVETAYCDTDRLCTAKDGVRVEGAKFTLYEGTVVDEANKRGEFTVGKDGVELPVLQPNKTYVLKEVAAPTGYILNPTSHTLSVDKTGNVRYVKVKDLRSLNRNNNELYIPNLKAPVPEVSLFKLGVKDLADCSWGSCSAADGELLEGAEFALYEGTAADTDHQIGKTFTVGKDGLKIPGLQVGKTYSLVEVTSPAGYQVNRTDLTFEVDADGKAKYQTDAGSEFFVDNKIFVPNQKAAPPAVKFKLFKLGVTDSALVRNCTVASKMCSAADGELLEGAKFVLYKGQKVDEANRLGEYVVGKDGLEISDLQVNEYYTLQEVEAPAGYERNTNAAVLKVKSDGVVQRRISKIYRDLVDNEFYFPNLKEPIQTIDIALNKVSDKDIPLENVKFDLYEAANPEKPVQNITTGNDGKATLTVMPGVKYRLVETQTYPGYALLPQAIEFQVDANGTVTIDKQNGNVNTVTGGDKTLKVVNYPEGKLPLSGHAGSLQVLLIGLSLLLAAVTITLFERKRN